MPQSQPIFNRASTARKRRCIKGFGKKKQKRHPQKKAKLKTRSQRHSAYFAKHRGCLTQYAPADLRAMPYHRFLETPYWRCVRILVFRRDGYRCKNCGTASQLQAHHLSYANHGSEHRFLNDLQTLCDTCHKDAHSPHIMPRREGASSLAVNRIAITQAPSQDTGIRRLGAFGVGSLLPEVTLTTCKPAQQDGSGSDVSKPGSMPEYLCSNDTRHIPANSSMARGENCVSRSGGSHLQNKIASPQ